jgi:hypothetical protein
VAEVVPPVERRRARASTVADGSAVKTLRSTAGRGPGRSSRPLAFAERERPSGLPRRRRPPATPDLQERGALRTSVCRRSLYCRPVGPLARSLPRRAPLSGSSRPGRSCWRRRGGAELEMWLDGRAGSTAADRPCTHTGPDRVPEGPRCSRRRATYSAPKATTATAPFSIWTSCGP